MQQDQPKTTTPISLAMAQGQCLEENSLRNRRQSKRRVPLSDECTAFITFEGQEPIVALVCDISSSGIGLLIDDDALKNVTEKVEVTHLNLKAFGKLVNQQEFVHGCNRVGIRWDATYTNIEEEKSEQPRFLIFVQKRDQQLVLLEQYRPDGVHRIYLSDCELAQVVEFLSVESDDNVGDNGVVPGLLDLSVGVESEKFEDGSFNITQGTDLIVGHGDVRFFLQPVG